MIEIEDFSDKNEPVVQKFLKQLRAEGLSESSVYQYKYALALLEDELTVPLKDARKEDLVGPIGEIRKGKAESTARTVLVLIKRFYKWVNGDDEYPESVDWIRPDSLGRGKLPDELLTKKEVRRMVDSCDHPRDRALIATLYESGLRAGEFVSLNLGSVEFENKMGRIILPSGGERQKTGQRRVPIVNSVPYLQEWINNHPLDGGDAPLWISVSTNSLHSRLRSDTLGEIVGRIARKADMDKHVYPHLFRHSRATDIARKGIYSEAEMRIIFGWAKGSDMPSRYIHLAGADVDEKFKRDHDIGDARDDRDEDPIEPLECPRCDYRNPAGAKFCNKCGLALDEEAALELDREENFSDEVASEVDEMDKEGSLQELIEEAVERRVREEMDEIRRKLDRGEATG